MSFAVETCKLEGVEGTEGLAFHDALGMATLGHASYIGVTLPEEIYLVGVV